MTAVNPSWINGLPLDDFRLRRIDSLLTMGDGTGLGARSGIVPGSGGFAVSVSGSTITVSPGIAAVYQPGQGLYRAALTASTDLTLNAADATLARIDLVYLRIWDDAVDGSGLNQADVVYLAGTPSSTPVAPTPTGTQIYMRLATISVPASGGGSPSVSQAVRPVTVAAGGIVPDGSASGLYVGMFRDNGTDLQRWNGTSWDTYQKTPGAWTTYTPTWSAATTSPSLGNGTLIGRYHKTGRTVHYHINLTAGSTTTAGSGTYSFSLPTQAANVGATYIGSAHLLGNDRWNGQFIISPNALNASPAFPSSTTNTRSTLMTAAIPETFTNGSQLRITGTYEAAG